MMTLPQKVIYELTMNQFYIPSNLLRVFNTKLVQPIVSYN